MLVSDLASARKFMGWPGTASERREGWYHQGGGWGGVHQHRVPNLRGSHSPPKSSLKLITALTRRVMRFWMLPECSPLFSFLFFSRDSSCGLLLSAARPNSPSSLLPMGKHFKNPVFNAPSIHPLPLNSTESGGADN